jgi:hypothetical protein
LISSREQVLKRELFSPLWAVLPASVVSRNPSSRIVFLLQIWS